MPESSELIHETIAELFADIADAIRSKTGGNSPIVADTFPDAINSIRTLSGYVIQGSDGFVTISNERGRDVMSEVTISTDGAVTQELEAGIIYHFTGVLTSLTITLAATTTMAHYHFDFLSGSPAPTISLPASLNMPIGYNITTNRRYEIDILNNYRTIGDWAYTPAS